MFYALYLGQPISFSKNLGYDISASNPRHVIPAIPNTQKNATWKERRKKMPSTSFHFMSRSSSNFAHGHFFYTNAILCKAEQDILSPFLKRRKSTRKDGQKLSDPMISLIGSEVRVLVWKLPQTTISATITRTRRVLHSRLKKKKLKKSWSREAETIMKSPNTKKSGVKKAQKWPKTKHWQEEFFLHNVCSMKTNIVNI